MARTFAEAVAEQGGVPAPPQPPIPPEAPTTTRDIIGNDDVLVDPRDGTVIDLGAAPSDQLADLILECRHREAMLTTWRKACEDELRLRLEREGRRVAIVGDYELQLDTGRGRDWDPDDLQNVLLDLVDQGIVTAGELTGLITREVKVDGRIAQRLLGQLSGEPKQLVEGCFRWVQKGRPRLTVNPVPDLADALPQGAASTARNHRGGERRQEGA